LKKAGFLLLSHVGQVFEKVNVSAVVVLVMKGAESLRKYTVVTYDKCTMTFGKESTLPISYVLQDQKVRLQCSELQGISWNFLTRQTACFGDYFIISRGEEMGKKNLFRVKDKPIPQGYIPVLTGEGITRFTQPRASHFARKSMVIKSRTIYDSPKIVVVKTGARFVAAIDYESLITLQSVYTLRPKGKMPCELGCALLNSSVLNAYLKWRITDQKKLFPQITQGNILEMPVPNVPKEKLKTIENLVKHIQNTKATNSATQISIYEREIDQLVYELYGLTDEEIKIVEGKDGN